jgi:hypothetical protein
MKTTGAWLELSLVTGALMVAMLAVMWAQHPGPDTCALSPETPRRLDLARDIDREHLTAEVAAAVRTARRYGRSTGGPATQQTNLLECEEALVREIATRHGVPPDRVRAGVHTSSHDF